MTTTTKTAVPTATTTTMTPVRRLLLALAGLSGAAGVALAALAAHVAGGATLATGAQLLVLHAGASVAVLAVEAGGRNRPAAIRTGAAGAMLLGAWLFAGDLAMRALAGSEFLWGTAPTGGTIMILAWLGLSASSVLRGPSALRGPSG